jgi:CRISPR-associated protein Csd1
VGDASTVFWAEEDSPFEEIFAALISGSDEDDPKRGIEVVRDWLSAPYTGVHRDAGDDTRFHVLGLAPNAARIAVRFWQTGTVREFADRIRQHFADIAIVAPSFETSHLPLWRLLAATALKGESKNVVPNLAGDTMRAILAGTDYPAALLQAAIRRCRAEQSVPFARAAVIKAYLNRRARLQSASEKELSMSLDRENNEPAYRLGRLFAALERIQAAAQPGINATIRERYYGAASSSPASVFPILLRLKNHHLAKLDSAALKTWYEKLLGEIFLGIGPDFPRHLDMPAQGRFAIGYYHQTQDFFTRKNPADSGATNDSIQGD